MAFIKWTDKELIELANGVLIERIDDPHSSISSIIIKVMKQILPVERHRSFIGWSQLPDLQRIFNKLWAEQITFKSADKQPALPAPSLNILPSPESPPPIVVQIEVEKPVDYIELLERLDLPTIAALRVAKKLKEKSQRTGHHKQTTAEAVAAQKPMFSILAAASPKLRPARVAIIGPLQGQFNDIQNKADEAKMNLKLLWEDKDKSTVRPPISCDYCIVTRHVRHDVFHNMQKQFGGRLFWVDGGIQSVVQKLNDIHSLHPDGMK